MTLHLVFSKDDAADKQPQNEDGPFFGSRARSHEPETITPVMWHCISGLWCVGLLHEEWTPGTLLQTAPVKTQLCFLEAFDTQDGAEVLFNNPCEKGSFFSNLKEKIVGGQMVDPPFDLPRYAQLKPILRALPGGKGCIPQ